MPNFVNPNDREAYLASIAAAADASVEREKNRAAYKAQLEQEAANAPATWRRVLGMRTDTPIDDIPLDPADVKGDLAAYAYRNNILVAPDGWTEPVDEDAPILVGRRRPLMSAPPKMTRSRGGGL